MVGLGNPGPRYAATRHNIGFLAVDALVRRLGGRPGVTAAPADIWEARVPEATAGSGDIGDAGVLLVQPRTWMNLSGDAVHGLLGERSTPAEDILVVVDDIYLPFGVQRLRSFGSDGGHNGLKSVQEALGSDRFPRLRVGVGPVPEGVDYKEFVLSEFSGPEAAGLNEYIDRVVGVVLAVLEQGVTAAQNAVAASNHKERITKGVGNA